MAASKYLCCFVAVVISSAAHGKSIMVASTYWEDTYTSTGARFNPAGLTAAHKTLPIGTKLTVRYGRRAIVVTVNDRGPFIRGRDIDLARGAAKALRFPGLGRIQVEPYPPLPKPRPVF